jgi:nucleotide-binding universal stress UspA family protein
MEAAVVLVPHDGTKKASAALVPARLAADDLGATIIIMHVSPTPIRPEMIKQRLGLSDEEIKGCILESMVADDAARGITRRAEQLGARLIAMSSHADDTSIGSVTADVVRRACCPVLAVRPEAAIASGKRLGRILVPHDASPISAEAVEWAALLAQRENAQLDILHIAAAGEPPPESGSLPVGPYLDQEHYDLKTWSDEFLHRFCAHKCAAKRVQPRLHLANGDPADEVIKFAKSHSSDLIVVAWHGSLDEGHARVVRTLLAQAPCLLLFIVPETFARPSDPAEKSKSAMIGPR